MPTFSKERYDRLEAFELPFMLTNAEAVSRAYWEYVQTYAADAFKDVQPLALHVSGPNVIHSRNQAVRNVEQIKNLRVSAVTRQTGNLLGALGAKPVGIVQAGAAPALSEPGLDAVLAPWEIVPTSELQQQARFHTELRTPSGALSTNGYVLAINKDAYQKMPSELRKIIDANAGIETSAWLGRIHQQTDQAGRAASDGTVITLTTEDAGKFREAAAQVEKQWVKLVTAQGFNGQKLLDGAKTLIRKHTK